MGLVRTIGIKDLVETKRNKILTMYLGGPLQERGKKKEKKKQGGQNPNFIFQGFSSHF